MTKLAARHHPALITAGPRPSGQRWARFVQPYQTYHRARVSRIAKETEHAVSVTLNTVDGLPVGMSAGQYLTLVADIDGRLVKRAYSLSQLPRDGNLTIAYKRVEGGVMSGYLSNRLREGDYLEFAGPGGDFVLPSSAPNPYVFAAAGSGVTPIMAMLLRLLEADGSRVPIVLPYGNRREDEILFRGVLLDGLAERHHNLTIRYFLTKPRKSWRGQRGCLGIDDLCDKRAKGATGKYFLCGPGNFNQVLHDQLIAQRVPAPVILAERFITLSRESRPYPADPHPVLFRFNGSEKEDTARPAETLLGAGLHAGVPIAVQLHDGWMRTLQGQGARRRHSDRRTERLERIRTSGGLCAGRRRSSTQSRSCLAR
ncbi:MAG: FAD-binding oxidoreductase [Paraburkholderia fungorum]|nr:FAD-binding oxidoreductase [Paraburkholderia fungorum]